MHKIKNFLFHRKMKNPESFTTPRIPKALFQPANYLVKGLQKNPCCHYPHCGIPACSAYEGCILDEFVAPLSVVLGSPVEGGGS
jgi:hypothetical protein